MFHPLPSYRGRNLHLAIVVPVAVVAAAAPALAGRGAATPSVTVVSPKAGATVSGTRVDFRVKPVNFTITAQATSVKPSEGHLHVTLDKRPFVALYTTHFVFKGVEPGAHVLKIEVVNSAHKPIRKPIIVKFSTT